MWEVIGFSRTSLRSSNPSMLGIAMSETMMSTLCFSSLAIAFFPSVALSMRKDDLSCPAMNESMSVLSSTTRSVILLSCSETVDFTSASSSCGRASVLSAFTHGSSTQNRHPSVQSVSTYALPPDLSASRLTSDSPMPNPGFLSFPLPLST